MMSHKIKITQIRSGIGRKRNQKATLKALGLRKLHQTVFQNDVPHIRGMVNTVKHLIEFEVVEE